MRLASSLTGIAMSTRVCPAMNIKAPINERYGLSFWSIVGSDSMGVPSKSGAIGVSNDLPSVCLNLRASASIIAGCDSVTVFSLLLREIWMPRSTCARPPEPGELSNEACHS